MQGSTTKDSQAVALRATGHKRRSVAAVPAHRHRGLKLEGFINLDNDIAPLTASLRVNLRSSERIPKGSKHTERSYSEKLRGNVRQHRAIHSYDDPWQRREDAFPGTLAARGVVHHHPAKRSALLDDDKRQKSTQRQRRPRRARRAERLYVNAAVPLSEPWLQSLIVPHEN